MMVRCGSCRNQFDVPGPGRFTCPICGSVNAVRAAAPPAGGPPTAASSPVQPPPPRPPDQPSPRITCSACDFSFIVGPVPEAKCPNCGAAVTTGNENAAVEPA